MSINTNRQWDMLLIDFDGVISRNSVTVLLDAYHCAINEFIPTPFEVSKEQVKSTICLPPEALQQAIAMSLQSQGLGDKQEAYFAVFQQIVGERIKQIQIDPAFYQFVDWCRENGQALRIFSAADPRMPHVSKVIQTLGDDVFFPMKERSKESLTTYPQVCLELNVEPQKCLLVDDACQALRSAKLNSLTTVMMTNEIFTDTDYVIWQQHIDHKIESFESLKALVSA